MEEDEGRQHEGKIKRENCVGGIGVGAWWPRLGVGLGEGWVANRTHALLIRRVLGVLLNPGEPPKNSSMCRRKAVITVF